MSLVINVFVTLHWGCGFKVNKYLVLDKSAIFIFDIILLQTIKI